MWGLLVYSTKPTLSRDDRGGQVKTSLAWRLQQAYGVAVIYPQNRRFLGYTTNSRPNTRCGGDGIRVRRGALRWGTCSVITELVSTGSKTVVDVCPPDGNIHFFSKVPLCGVYLLFVL
jgi:hypothetical protein